MSECKICLDNFNNLIHNICLCKTGICINCLNKWVIDHKKDTCSVCKKKFTNLPLSIKFAIYRGEIISLIFHLISLILEIFVYYDIYMGWYPNLSILYDKTENFHFIDFCKKLIYEIYPNISFILIFAVFMYLYYFIKHFCSMIKIRINLPKFNLFTFSLDLFLICFEYYFLSIYNYIGSLIINDFLSPIIDSQLSIIDSQFVKDSQLSIIDSQFAKDNQLSIIDNQFAKYSRNITCEYLHYFITNTNIIHMILGTFVLHLLVRSWLFEIINSKSANLSSRVINHTEIISIEPQMVINSYYYNLNLKIAITDNIKYIRQCVGEFLQFLANNEWTKYKMAEILVDTELIEMDESGNINNIQELQNEITIIIKKMGSYMFKSILLSTFV